MFPTQDDNIHFSAFVFLILALLSAFDFSQKNSAIFFDDISNMVNKALLNLVLLFLVFTGGYGKVTFKFENYCEETLWLATNPSSGDLDPEFGRRIWDIYSMDDPWTGSIWARTKCAMNSSGYFVCETGDCGPNDVFCQGPPPTYPITLMNFDINNNVVSYEISLIHGHNVGIRIVPDGGTLVEGGSDPCPYLDCSGKISDVCPSFLVAYNNVCPSFLVAYNKDGVYVGCNSACDVLNDPKYCCTQQPCQPNEYSQRFKDLCPLAHTFPGDTPPLYKCSGAKSYNVTFCPF